MIAFPKVSRSLLVASAATIVAAALTVASCRKSDDDDAPPAPPIFATSKMTLSFASTADQKKAALGLINLASTLPKTANVYKMGSDGKKTGDAVSCTLDSKGNCDVSLMGGYQYISEGLDSSGAVMDEFAGDTFAVAKTDKLSAKKQAEKRAVVVEKGAAAKKKLAMMQVAVVAAAKTNAAKPAAKQKSLATVATLVNTKTVAKAADKLVKAETKDKKKAEKKGTTVDTKAQEKKQTLAAKATEKAGKKADEKKAVVAKKAVEKKKTALGLLADATDDEIDAYIEEQEAIADDCQQDPTNVAKFNAADGVDESKLADYCRDLLVKADPANADFLKVATAEEDLDAATKEASTEVAAESPDEAPSADDLLELRASGISGRAEEIALTSTTWESLSASQKASATAMFEIALGNLDGDTMDKVATAIAGDISEADAAAYPIVNVLRLLQQNGSATAIATAVSGISSGFSGEDSEDFTSDQSEEASDEASESEASTTEATTTDDTTSAEATPTPTPDGDGFRYR